MKSLLTLALAAACCAVLPLHAGDGDRTPIDFTLPKLGGGELALSELRGQWVVANYWATWCAPCRKEIPDLSALHDRRADVTVLGLAYEEVDPEVFAEFLLEFPASYPILVADVFEPPAALGPPRVLPTTFLIDPKGVLVKTFYGPVTSGDIVAAIDSPPAAAATPAAR